MSAIDNIIKKYQSMSDDELCEHFSDEEEYYPGLVWTPTTKIPFYAGEYLCAYSTGKYIPLYYEVATLVFREGKDPEWIYDDRTHYAFNYYSHYKFIVGPKS